MRAPILQTQLPVRPGATRHGRRRFGPTTIASELSVAVVLPRVRAALPLRRVTTDGCAGGARGVNIQATDARTLY